MKTECSEHCKRGFLNRRLIMRERQAKELDALRVKQELTPTCRAAERLHIIEEVFYEGKTVVIRQNYEQRSNL